MRAFKYISISDMNRDIRKNLSKIPRDIDFIIGVPRSGMLPATIIAEFINVPLIDIDSFVNGNTPSIGGRKCLFKEPDKTKRVLVVDDTVNSGIAMSKTIAKIKTSPRYNEYTFIYSCIYLEDERGKNLIDLYLKDFREYPKKDIQLLYEWNCFQHYPHIMNKMIFDIDGVLCTEEGRPHDSDEEGYKNYIASVKPLFVPKVPINCILTYRLSKYEDITREWLKKNGIKYNYLIMCNAPSWSERDRNIDSATMKASFYKEHPEFILFVESDDYQARRIYQLTSKQVLCTDTNTLYGDITL